MTAVIPPFNPRGYRSLEVVSDGRPRRALGRIERGCDMRDITRSAQLLAGAALVLALLTAAACGRPDSGAAPAASTTAAAAAAAVGPDGLTAFQREHGIGPVTAPVALADEVDETKASAGGAVFEQKCASCHKMTERYVGPALGGITSRRSPAFIMNMALNPLEMVQKHPESKKLLAEYYVPMPYQNLTQDDARNVLEYLRTQTPGSSH